MTFVCALCKLSDNNSVEFGEFIFKDDICVHLKCLFLSSSLKQNGDQNEGIHGFLLEDIRAEIKRISKVRCYYCSNYYAGLKCCHPNCKRNFHLVCGARNDAFNQYCEGYQSFCHAHHPNLRGLKVYTNELCCICTEEDAILRRTITKNGLRKLQSPCCRNGIFHRFCLQKYADNSGYFVKCPLCSNKDEFVKLLPKLGVFLSDKEATWEGERDSLTELLERPVICTADICYNRLGRGIESTRNPLLRCVTCGSNAMHEKCWRELCESDEYEYNCEECFSILQSIGATNFDDSDSEKASLSTGSHVMGNSYHFILSEEDDINSTSRSISMISPTENVNNNEARSMNSPSTSTGIIQDSPSGNTSDEIETAENTETTDTQESVINKCEQNSDRKRKSEPLEQEPPKRHRSESPDKDIDNNNPK